MYGYSFKVAKKETKYPEDKSSELKFWYEPYAAYKPSISNNKTSISNNKTELSADTILNLKAQLRPILDYYQSNSCQSNFSRLVDPQDFEEDKYFDELAQINIGFYRMMIPQADIIPLASVKSWKPMNLTEKKLLGKFKNRKWKKYIARMCEMRYVYFEYLERLENIFKIFGEDLLKKYPGYEATMSIYFHIYSGINRSNEFWDHVNSKIGSINSDHLFINYLPTVLIGVFDSIRSNETLFAAITDHGFYVSEIKVLSIIFYNLFSEIVPEVQATLLLDNDFQEYFSMFMSEKMYRCEQKILDEELPSNVYYKTVKKNKRRCIDEFLQLLDQVKITQVNLENRWLTKISRIQFYLANETLGYKNYQNYIRDNEFKSHDAHYSKEISTLVYNEQIDAHMKELTNEYYLARIEQSKADYAIIMLIMEISYLNGWKL